MEILQQKSMSNKSQDELKSRTKIMGENSITIKTDEYYDSIRRPERD